MEKIALVVVDGGAFGTLKPVAEMLMEIGHKVSWYTQEGAKAKGKLEKQGIAFTLFQAGQVDYSGIDVLVAGVSGLKAGVEFFMAKEAREKGIPVIKVLDFWGTGQPHEKGFAPDRLCVLDEPSVEYEALMRNMPKKNIRVTGDPKMDELIKIDRSQAAKRRNRAKLGIIDPYFFVFAGPSSHARVMEVFPAVVEAIKGSGVDVLMEFNSHCESFPSPVTLGTLWHPSHKDNKEDIEECHRLLKQANIAFVPDMGLRAQLSNPEIYVAADLVIGVTSTETVVSCYLGRQTLNIIYPGGVNYRDILEPRGIVTIPTVECGAALVAEDDYDVRRIINTLYGDSKPAIYAFDGDPHPQRKMQEKYYQLDGKNTARVVEAIEEVL